MVNSSRIAEYRRLLSHWQVKADIYHKKATDSITIKKQQEYKLKFEQCKQKIERYKSLVERAKK